MKEIAAILSKRRIGKRSLHDAAVHELREMILDGRLKPGEHLVETEFCAALGISRTPLREALKSLESEGLLALNPRRGAYVTKMTDRDVSELFEVISDLERLAVSRAVERMSEADLNRLRRRHARMIGLHRDGRLRECFQVDYEIHNFLVEKANNSILSATHNTLMVRARRGRYAALLSRRRWNEAMAEHEQFMQAIIRRDAAAAGELMHRHVSRTGDVLREFLTEEESRNPE